LDIWGFEVFENLKPIGVSKQFYSPDQTLCLHSCYLLSSFRREMETKLFITHADTLLENHTTDVHDYK